MKGIWSTIESVIACIMIAVFLIFITRTYLIGPQKFDASAVAYDALKALDERGVLRSSAVSLDYSSINSEVRIAGYNHTVNLCGVGGACAGPAPPAAADVWVGSYFIAGNNQYKPMEVKLYLWK